MRGFIKKLTVFISILATSIAERPVYINTNLHIPGEAEFRFCDFFVYSLVFDYTPLNLGSDSSWDRTCGYPPTIGSMLLCAAHVADDQSDNYRKKIFKAMTKICKQSSYNHDWEFYEAQYENATNYYVPFDEISNTSLPLYSPTIPNTSSETINYKGYQGSMFNINTGTWFSVGICGYFLLLILIGAIHNFIKQSGVGKSLNNSLFAKLCQKYIVFPTLFPNGKYAQEYGWKYFSWLFPNRIQFVTDLFLFALHVAFYCVDYRYKGAHRSGSSKQLWQVFLADRTGIMSFGKIPLLILFAGRNNFLLSITGWSYATFLHFHKVVANWMFLDAMIHSVAYTAELSGYYVRNLKQRYFACGVAATVIAGVMLLFAMHPVRRFYYEYFLLMHVILAICFIVMCWYHCRELGWLEWIIAACAVWFLDRLLRVIRLAAFGWRTATITVVADDMMKIEVLKPSWWFQSPGTYNYIYFSGWIFWENHPFTSVVEGDKLCAYIKVKKGVTYRVWNKLLKHNNVLTTKVCVEGPYGGSCYTKLKKYDEVLLLAGGSGAPGILESAGCVNKGKMVWVAPTLQTVKAYHNLIQNAKVDLDVYITREQGIEKSVTISEFNESETENLSTESSEKEPENEKKLNLSLENPVITINYCRPNLSEVIDTAVRNANSKSVGIMSCGPPQMSDEIRNIIANKVTSWEKSVDYFDELQVW